MTRPPAAIIAALLAAATPLLADADDDRAQAVFSAAYADSCGMAFSASGDLLEPPQRFQANMPFTQGEPEPVTIWQFRCDAGAYNLIDVFVMKTVYDGTQPVALATPSLRVVNRDPEDYESPVERIEIDGWSADTRIVNASFDPATGTISGHSYWRGLGDAYDASTWVLRDGGYQLIRFEADASYDGETEPQLVLTFP
ncbi:MAG: hypothetical protein R3D63_04930 [Paracoccaceae bacterium]